MIETGVISEDLSKCEHTSAPESNIASENKCLFFYFTFYTTVMHFTQTCFYWVKHCALIKLVLNLAYSFTKHHFLIFQSFF